MKETVGISGGDEHTKQIFTHKKEPKGRKAIKWKRVILESYEGEGDLNVRYPNGLSKYHSKDLNLLFFYLYFINININIDMFKYFFILFSTKLCTVVEM